MGTDYRCISRRCIIGWRGARNGSSRTSICTDIPLIMDIVSTSCSHTCTHYFEYCATITYRNATDVDTARSKGIVRLYCRTGCIRASCRIVYDIYIICACCIHRGDITFRAAHTTPLVSNTRKVRSCQRGTLIRTDRCLRWSNSYNWQSIHCYAYSSCDRTTMVIGYFNSIVICSNIGRSYLYHGSVPRSTFNPFISITGCTTIYVGINIGRIVFTNLSIRSCSSSSDH